MMYMIFIIDHIHHLMNKSNMLTFTYNSEGVYKFSGIWSIFFFPLSCLTFFLSLLSKNLDLFYYYNLVINIIS